MEARLQREIEHGRFLAREGPGEVWNWEGPAGRLRWQRRVIMLTNHLLPEMKVLELGCGTAYFTRELAKTGATITAIDISPDLLALARHNCPADSVTFEAENAYDLSYPDNSFDSVVGSSVLHHLEVEKALCEILRVLKPGGSLYFTEPNMLNPQIALQKNLPALKRRLGDSPDETAFFRWSLNRLMRETGFREIEITPFDFLHPWLPSSGLRIAQLVANSLERMPIIREIAGSLYIRAIKP